MPGPEQGVLTGALGVASNSSDWLRDPNALRAGNNINMVKRGILTSRFNGWSRQRNSVFNSAAAFLDFALFVDGSGTATLCFQVGNTLYSYNIGTSTEKSINTGLSSTALPCMRMFQPYNAAAGYMVLCNGVDQPRKITSVSSDSALQLNGGNYPQATAGPMAVKTYSKPTFCEQFGDRMVYAGFSGAPVKYDVLICNAGTGETCTASTPLVETDGGTFTVNPRLGAITGVKSFKLSNQTNDQVLLIAQERGVSIIVGNGATSYESFVLSDEYGIPSNRTWVQVQNDLMFLASDGIRSFTSLAANANLLNATLTFGVQDLVRRFNKSALKNAHAAHAQTYQEIQFFFPTDASTSCNAGVVLNYNTSATRPGLPIDPIVFTRDNTTTSCGFYFNDVFYGGGYDGLLQQHYTTNTVDGNPSTFRLNLAFIRSSDPFAISELTRGQFVCEGLEQKFVVNTFYYAKDADGSSRRKLASPSNKELSAALAPKTILGNSPGDWQLGVSAFSRSSIRYLDYYPISMGHGHDVEISGSQADHVIDFLGFTYELKVGGKAS